MEYYAVSSERFDEYLEYCDVHIVAIENDEALPEPPDPSWNDAYQKGKTETAKALLQNAGAEYLNLFRSLELDELLHVSSFPSTYFIDNEGKLLLTSITGANLDEYRKAVVDALFLVG